MNQNFDVLKLSAAYSVRSQNYSFSRERNTSAFLFVCDIRILNETNDIFKQLKFSARMLQGIFLIREKSKAKNIGARIVKVFSVFENFN